MIFYAVVIVSVVAVVVDVIGGEIVCVNGWSHHGAGSRILVVVVVVAIVVIVVVIVVVVVVVIVVVVDRGRRGCMCERWVESRRGLLGGLSEWWRPCGPSALRDQRETGPEPETTGKRRQNFR